MTNAQSAKLDTKDILHVTNVIQPFLVILIVKNAIVTLMDHQANNVTYLETVLVFLILLDLNVIDVLMATSTFQIAQVLFSTIRANRSIFITLTR